MPLITQIFVTLRIMPRYTLYIWVKNSQRQYEIIEFIDGKEKKK